MGTQSLFTQWANTLLAKFSDETITVFGDFFLNVYWSLDISETVTSIETGLPVRRVDKQRSSLGGAASVAANLSKLGVGEIRAVGAVGDDIFGKKLTELLRVHQINLDRFVEDGSLQTPVHAKFLRRDKEESRIEFGTFNTYNEVVQERLIHSLESALIGSDAVIMNQPASMGLFSPQSIAQINQIVAAHPEILFLVDSHFDMQRCPGAMLKLDLREAASLLGDSQNGAIPSSNHEIIAKRLYQQFGKPTFVTREENGLVAVGADGVVHSISGIEIIEKVDRLGASNAVAAGIAAAMAAGASAKQAAEFANVAAMINLPEPHVMGTAYAKLLLETANDLNYVFSPELAESPRLAHYLPDTEIEITSELPCNLDIKHCIFDHDGTLSVLREGWECIMEPMMLRIILGARYGSADESTFRHVQESVRDFIDRTTGIQTLIQMKGLVELVRQGGFVDQKDLLDEHEYKRIYDAELKKMITRRIDKLRKGELSSIDFAIKNATSLLNELRRIGIKLYLASGTDHDDVVAEAEAMGYACLFEGRIFGAVGDVNIEAKKIVLERIIREHGLAGHEFATFGDGPVEMRETRKRGGIAVGVASDELRRYGLNVSKRRRLIRAGANLIVPDFSQFPVLLHVLQLS